MESITSPSFIGQYIFDDLTVCDDIIDYFDNSSATSPGLVGDGKIIPDYKTSTDLCFLALPVEMQDRYLIQLQECLNLYKEDYEHCDQGINSYNVKGFNINIQHYKPGEFYKKLHCENTGHHSFQLQRHLVFMTYLNDVEDQGGTEFHYQNFTAQPVKGLTLIWPAAWTHMHRGVPSPTQHKYIVTGWYTFKNVMLDS